jgi:hypothetical protein
MLLNSYNFTSIVITTDTYLQRKNYIIYIYILLFRLSPNYLGSIFSLFYYQLCNLIIFYLITTIGF